MANVFDYLKWRDDIPLDDLNEIDVLIFNRLAYFPLEELSPNKKLTIEEAYQTINLDSKKFAKREDLELFEKISNSIRYKDLLLSNIISKKDFKNEESFMAVTIHLPKNSIYIAFKGTTGDIVDWKEDFNMTFKTVPAQIDALNYLNNLRTNKKIYVGGHSKGGNLAVFAASGATKKIKNKIVKVYNYDGPGFLSLTSNYYSIKDKIVSYLPGDSIVGRLLNLDNEYIVIKSNGRGLREHNLYNWQLEKNHFVLDKLSKESDKIKNIFDEFLNNISVSNRQKIIDDIYNIIIKSGIKNVKDLNINYLKELVTSYNTVDEESKKLIISIIGILWSSTVDSLRN